MTIQSLPVSGPRLLDFLRSLPKLRTDTLGFLLDAARTYGDAVRFPLGRKGVYFFNHPEAVQHVLQKNAKNYSKQTLQYRALSAVTGNGLATSEGPFWLQQRRLIQPFFSNSTYTALIQSACQITTQMLDRWDRSRLAHHPLDIQQEMLQLALQIVCTALLQVEVEDPQRLTQAVLTVIDTIVEKTRSVIPPILLPWSREAKAQGDALEYLEETVSAWIAQKRRTDSSDGDLISSLLRSPGQFPSPEAHARQVRDEVMTFIIAGHETVASALTWSMILLAQNERLQDDLSRTVKKTLHGQDPSLESMGSISSVRALVEEAMRLYPPVWLITRRAVGDDQVLGIEVPSGSLIILCTYTLHRHPVFWDDPDRFDPGRFTRDPPSRNHRFQYIPFGAGSRLCIGGHFAMLEAQTVISMVLNKFHVKSEPGLSTVPLAAMVTLRPAVPVYLKLTSIPVEKPVSGLMPP